MEGRSRRAALEGGRKRGDKWLSVWEASPVGVSQVQLCTLEHFFDSSRKESLIDDANVHLVQPYNQAV